MQAADHPRTETIVCVIAVCLTVGFILFGTRELPNRSVFAVLAWGWCAARLLHVRRTYRIWHDWHTLIDLRVDPTEYDPARGIAIGYGFVWTAHHAAALSAYRDRFGIASHCLNRHARGGDRGVTCLASGRAPPVSAHHHSLV